METPNSQPVPTAPATDDKTVAIVAYLTLIGFIVAIVLHNSPGKKTALGAYHLRQVMALFIAAFALSILGRVIVIPILGLLFGMGASGDLAGLALVLSVSTFITWAIFLVISVLWLIGLIAALNGELKPIPLIGPLAEQHLRKAFE